MVPSSRPDTHQPPDPQETWPVLAARSMAFTELLEQTGAGGLFQALQALTLLLLSIWMPFLMLAENFSAGHRCWAPLLDNGSEVSTHLTPEALLAVSIPPGLNQEPHQCLHFRQPQW